MKTGKQTGVAIAAPATAAAATLAAAAAASRWVGSCANTSCHHGPKLRRALSKESSGGKKSAPDALKGKKASPNPPNLTATRVARIISQLDNKRGSTLDSIRSKLMRSGYKTTMFTIRVALERAVRSGLLKEIREERFFVPPKSGTRLTSSTSTASSRNSAKVARRVSSKGQLAHYQHSRKQAVSSASGSSAKRFQRRRPPQGRRPVLCESAAEENDEGREDADAGVGDGDVEADSGSGNGMKNATSSRVSVSEPVAACDAIMVFGTR